MIRVYFLSLIHIHTLFRFFISAYHMIVNTVPCVTQWILTVSCSVSSSVYLLTPCSWRVPPAFPVWSPVSLLLVSVGSFLSRVSAHSHRFVGSTSERCHAASVSLSGPLHSAWVSRSVRGAASGGISLFVTAASIPCACVYHIFFTPVSIHLWMDI